MPMISFPSFFILFTNSIGIMPLSKALLNILAAASSAPPNRSPWVQHTMGIIAKGSTVKEQNKHKLIFPICPAYRCGTHNIPIRQAADIKHLFITQVPICSQHISTRDKRGGNANSSFASHFYLSVLEETQQPHRDHAGNTLASTEHF